MDPVELDYEEDRDASDNREDSDLSGNESGSGLRDREDDEDRDGKNFGEVSRKFTKKRVQRNAEITDDEVTEFYDSLGYDPVKQSALVVYIHGSGLASEHECMRIFSEYHPDDAVKEPDGHFHMFVHFRDRTGLVQVLDSSEMEEEEGVLKEVDGEDVEIVDKEVAGYKAKMHFDDYVKVDIDQHVIPDGPWRVLVKHVSDRFLVLLRFAKYEEIANAKTETLDIQSKRMTRKRIASTDADDQDFAPRAPPPGQNVFAPDGKELTWRFEHDLRAYEKADGTIEKEEDKSLKEWGKDDQPSTAKKVRGRGAFRAHLIGTGADTMRADTEAKEHDGKKDLEDDEDDFQTAEKAIPKPKVLPIKFSHAKMAEPDGNFVEMCRICHRQPGRRRYGAWACDSCKIFFLRSATRKTPHVCAREGRCQFPEEKCPGCRFNRCVQEGMVPESVARRDGCQRRLVDANGKKLIPGAGGTSCDLKPGEPSTSTEADRAIDMTFNANKVRYSSNQVAQCFARISLHIIDFCRNLPEIWLLSPGDRLLLIARHQLFIYPFMLFFATYVEKYDGIILGLGAVFHERREDMNMINDFLPHVAVLLHRYIIPLFKEHIIRTTSDAKKAQQKVEKLMEFMQVIVDLAAKQGNYFAQCVALNKAHMKGRFSGDLYLTC
ncbi:unnamed protein product, partial [Mesorhabditis spiculigera]